MGKVWIDVKRASQIVGIKPNTLYVLSHKGRFAPVYRIGRLVRFAEDEVYKWIESQKVVREHE